MRGLIWSKSYLSLCIFYMVKFTSHENISRLWVCLHKDNSVYNTSWVSRSIHHTGRTTLHHPVLRTCATLHHPVLRVCATLHHLHHYAIPRFYHYFQQLKTILRESERVACLTQEHG